LIRLKNKKILINYIKNIIMSLPIPDAETAVSCLKLSIISEKKIDTYFYKPSLPEGLNEIEDPRYRARLVITPEGKFIEIPGSGENERAHTTMINNLYCCDGSNCIIAVTENTIHVISNQIVKEERQSAN
jgi:hypothetical protein